MHQRKRDPRTQPALAGGGPRKGGMRRSIRGSLQPPKQHEGTDEWREHVRASPGHPVAGGWVYTELMPGKASLSKLLEGSSGWAEGEQSRPVCFAGLWQIPCLPG